MTDPRIGKVCGNVRLLKRLGAGAMGVVYEGVHTVTKQPVAVKLLTHATGNAGERFEREAQAASSVHSPHVVQVVDAGVSDGQQYLVMELVVGRSIGDLLEEVIAQDKTTPPTDRPVGSMDPRAVMRLGSQVAHGLSAIHDCGIVHRDIKPDNVMVTADGQVKIADLGLAKRLDDPDLLRLTGTGMVVGTPLYVSPEGIRDPQHVTGAADIYSLGATLYHLLAGRPPFDGKTAYEVMRGHLEERFRPLLQINPALPPHLVAVVEGCLAKKPEVRPTPAAIVAAFTGEPPAMGAGQSPLIRAIGIVAALVVVFGAVAWFAVGRGAVATQAVSVPTDAVLKVTADATRFEVKIDDGPWAVGAAAGVSVAAGERLVMVRALQPGAHQTWTGKATAVIGAPATVEVNLAPTPVAAAVRLAIPGQGMIFIDGLAFSNGQQATFLAVGTYAVGRWDGSLWTSTTVIVTPEGNAALGPMTTRPQPEGPAWWRTLGPDAREMESHHAVSWYEADQVRATRQLAVPPGWRRQGDQPHQPVVELNPALLDAVAHGILSSGGRLPEPRQAKILANRLGAPVWAKDVSGWKAVGGPAVNAWMVLVP